MKVAALCTRDVVAIHAEAGLREASALMCEEHVGALVVVTSEDPPKVVGMVTDRDLALEVLGRGDGAADLRIGHLAKAPPVAVPSSASVREAIAAMEAAGVRRLLVVDDDAGVVGIVSADDLLAAVADELAALARALRRGIEREKSERGVVAAPPRQRPVYPAFGLAAMQ